MSDSPLNSSIRSNPYCLLRSYEQQARVNAKAYGMSEGYYRWLNKALSYPLIILSAVNTVLAGLDVNRYTIMSIALTTLIISGLRQSINPQDKENKASQMRIEYSEIKANVRQYILSNHRTIEEIKAYAEIIHEQLNIWNSLSPPCQDRFIIRARKECALRSRPHAIKNDSVRVIIPPRDSLSVRTPEEKKNIHL